MKTRKIPPQWRLIRPGAEILHLIQGGKARCGIETGRGVRSSGRSFPGRSAVTLRCLKCDRWQDMEPIPPFGRSPGSYHPKKNVAFPVVLQLHHEFTEDCETRDDLRRFLIRNRSPGERIIHDANGRKWRVRLEAVLTGAADR